MPLNPGHANEKEVNVFLQITDENRAIIEQIRDYVITSELNNDDDPRATRARNNRPSPLAMSEVLRTSTSSMLPSTSSSGGVQFPLAPTLTPFQLALCQSLISTFPMQFGVSSTPAPPVLPLFAPPAPQPAPNQLDINEGLRLLQYFWAAQNSRNNQ